MPDNTPNMKELSNQGEMKQTLKDFIQKLRGLIQRDDADRLQWKNKMIVAVNQRLGIKRYSEFPYPGAPDVPLPETDKLIKKQVPNLVLSAWSPKTLCSVTVKQGYAPNPDWDEKAKKAELGMNQVLRSKEVGWFKKLLLAADYAKQHGHALFRTREEFCSRWVHKIIDLTEYDEETIKGLKSLDNEGLRAFLADRFTFDIEDEDDLKTINWIIKQFRGGKEVIEFDYEEISSYPQIDVPIPTKVIVPPYTTDITKSNRITYEYFLSIQEMERLMEKGIFRKKDLAHMSFSKEDDDIVEQQKRRNEGIVESGDSELFRIHECYTWYRESDDEELHRTVFTFLADCTSPEDSLLSDIDFQFEFDGWNWDKYDNETKDERYYSSRGLPEQIRAYQEIMERAMNNMLIRDEMTNTPMWEVLSTSDLLDSHIRFVPGQKLPVRALGQEISPIALSQVPDMSSQAIMQVAKAYVEEYQSSNDYLFRNSTNAGGGKTLGEIQTGIQHNSAPLNLEVTAFNDTLSSVYQKVFEIMKERLGDSMYVDGIEVTREDFNFPADVKSNGQIEMSNMEMSTQKAAMRLQALMNPAFAEMVTPEDKYNALRDWLEKDGVKDPDKFSTNPMEVMQDQSAQLKQQLMQMQQQLQAMSEQGDEQMKDIEKNKKDLKKQDVQMEVKDDEEIMEIATGGMESKGMPNGQA